MTDLLTIRDAVDYLQGTVGKTLLYRLFEAGELKGTRIGGKVILYRTSLDKYILDHENGKAPAAPVEVATPGPLPLEPVTASEPRKRGRRRLDRLGFRCLG
jgi:excisionase family DNA binding protein